MERESSDLFSKLHRSLNCDLKEHKINWQVLRRQCVWQRYAHNGYQRFPRCEPVEGQNIALGAVPAYRASMPTYFLPSQLIQLQFLQNISMVALPASLSALSFPLTPALSRTVHP